MENLKEYTKHLIVKVLNHEVYIVVTGDVKESRIRRTRLLGDVDLHPHVRALFSSNGCGVSFIFLPLDCENYVRCHEAYHCVNEIMRFIGANHENEVVAYTLSYLIDEIDKFLEKIEKKSKKALTKKPGSGKLKKVKG